MLNPPNNVDNASASSSKLKDIFKNNDKGANDFNFLMNFNNLSELLSCFGCPDCEKIDSVTLSRKNKYGLRYIFIASCSDCKWSHEFCNTKNSKKALPTKTNDINLQTVLSFREIGCGYAKMKNFSMLMNMESPMSKRTYNNTNNQLHKAYTSAMKNSVSAAAIETRKLVLKDTYEAEKVADCKVSVDGTWQRRGHASINGVVVAISTENGKVLDTSVLSKQCKGCQAWSKCKNSPKYDNWKANHVCQMNHEKSSGSMEGAGAVLIWNRSLNNKLRYVSYIGDGDTSSYAEVVASKPYDNIDIEKLECIGHVNKRMGSRCRNLIVKSRGSKMADGKPLSGKGRLTNKAINILQNYYGMAIRQNTDNMYVMKKCIWAVLFYNSDITDKDFRHRFCPRHEKSWCLYQQDKITGKNTYKVKLNLPLAVKNVLIPIFKDLSDDSLLSRCLHGHTQNANESFNSLIWKRCPKDVFVSRKLIEIATFSAIVNFNDGFSGLAKVFNYLNISIGVSMKNALGKSDNNRIVRMECKSSDKAKRRRKTLNHLKKGYLDKEKQKEVVPAYKAGGH